VPITIAAYEPVSSFQVSENRDGVSFIAYGVQWEFDIWLSDVVENNANHFYGRLRGGTQLLSSFTLAPNYVTGMIVLTNETLWLEAPPNSGNPYQLFIHKSSDVNIIPGKEQELRCGEANIPPGTPEQEQQAKRSIAERGYKIVALLVDQFWLSPAYNPWYTIDATYGLMNDVNVVYANVGLFGQGYQVLAYLPNYWTTADQTYTMLTYASNWQQYYIPAAWNIVTYLVGNNVGGIAWMGGGCGRYGPYYRTSVAGVVPYSRLWTVKNIAHEIGHTRGANHDFGAQCGQYQSGGCQCSVMSYCFPNAYTAGGPVNYFSWISTYEIAVTCN